MVRVYKIIKNTSCEGPNKRFCIWTQGCNHHCEDCYAKETWPINSGIEYSIDELFTLIKEERNKIEGVTFLGGEPFLQYEELSKLSKLIKSLDLSIVCFTGFTYEELKQKNTPEINDFLGNIDLLIDGKFVKEKFDLSRPWVGSSNQRYIFLSDRYNLDEIMQYKNKIEIRFSKDGKVEINGMADFSDIENKLYLQSAKNIVK